MTAAVRVSILAVAIGGILAAAPCVLAGQEPVVSRQPPDTTTDSTKARRDTVSTTERLLKAQREQRVQLHPLSRAGTGGLLPPGGRIVLTRDSIDWAAAEDLGELLGRIPGVYLERGGWITSPVLPDYLGRGAGSVEYFLDGVPMRPIGPDSLATDPSTFPLGFLDRVEIVPDPGMLRVYLFTRAHDREAPRTKIGAAQGDRGVARYFGSYERRYLSGIGLGLAADYVTLNRNSAGYGGGNIASGWAQLGYVPSRHFGVQAQYVTQHVNRNLLLDDAGNDTLLAETPGVRTDEQLRASWHGRTDGMGASFDLLAAHTSWTSDSTPGNVSVGQLGAIYADRHPLWSTQVTLWHDSRWRPYDGSIDVGWAPTRMLSASTRVVAQGYSAGRHGASATARVGLSLPFGFTVAGAIADGQRVLAPADTTLAAEHFTDAQLGAAFQSRLLGVDGAYVWNDSWRPQAFSEFRTIPSYQPLPGVHWMTLHARLTPLNWLTLETVYEHPLGGVLHDAAPPHHALSTFTIRSRFLRNFPSGIFALKVQGVAETWSPGIGGLSAAGDPVPLAGVTLYRGILQMQLGPFIVYYDRVNLQATDKGAVPGYRIEPLGSSFGIRWEFSN